MSDETTTEMLAEIEGQAAEPEPQADYTPPEGWRKLQVGETITPGDVWIRPDDKQAFDASRIGQQVHGRMCYIRRIPEPQPEPQPVQVREGRWRTRNGEIRHVIPTPADHSQAGRCSWRDAQYYETWYPSGRYTLHGNHPLDLLEYLGPIEPEPGPERIITPDDVAAEALAGVHDQGKAERQAQVEFLKGRLQEEKAVTTKRLQQIQELRSEVSYVQGLLGDEKRRFTELETLASDLRAVNAATEKAINSATRDKADLEHRLQAVAAEFGVQLETNNRLQAQLEAVKAELVQVSKDRHALQVELDAREQVSQAVSKQWEESYNKGAAQAVETIAEWTAPVRACGSLGLAYQVLQNLPHIMRSLTGLADTED